MFSPHAWGWTFPTAIGGYHSNVFPTRVGVDRETNIGKNSMLRFPHTRGGGPQQLRITSLHCKFSPHAWGWTVSETTEPPPAIVFPTRVGVDLQATPDEIQQRCFPHTRGGGPFYFRVQDGIFQFSPHAWGWTATRATPIDRTGVFPTRVGVDRGICCMLSPPGVFPTRVGVDRGYLVQVKLQARFPHTRGGGPYTSARTPGAYAFSPHAWGWTEGIHRRSH